MRVSVILLLLIPLVWCYRRLPFSPNKLDPTENEHLQNICGRSQFPSLRELKSINGIAVNRRVAPWAIAIIYSEDHNQGIGQRVLNARETCSGTLISNRHVLTAAHCINNDRFNDLLVVMDDDCGDAHANCRLNPLHVRRIKRVMFPSEFSTVNPIKQIMHNNDIAILELNRDIPFSINVYPACLGNTLPQLGDQLKVFGFGSDTEPSGSPSKLDGVLKLIETEVVNCKVKSNILNKEYDHFCTINYQHPCEGDSGAGLISQLSDGTNVVMGVISNGLDCNILEIEPYAEEDSNVRVAPHSNWICSVTGVCPEAFDGYSYRGILAKRTNKFI